MFDWFTRPLFPVGTTFPAKFDYLGERIGVVYRVIAPAEFARIRAEYLPQGGLAFPIALALAYLARWDLEDEGSPAPITRDTFRRLPRGFVIALQSAVLADLTWRAAEAAKGVKFDA